MGKRTQLFQKTYTALVDVHTAQKRCTQELLEYVHGGLNTYTASEYAHSLFSKVHTGLNYVHDLEINAHGLFSKVHTGFRIRTQLQFYAHSLFSKVHTVLSYVHDLEINVHSSFQKVHMTLKTYTARFKGAHRFQNTYTQIYTHTYTYTHMYVSECLHGTRNAHGL